MTKLHYVGAIILLAALTLAGCEDREVNHFNDAVRELNRMLTTTGNDDRKVIAACSAVEEAFKKIDQSRVPKEQADAMKGVATSAELWRTQLTLIVLNAISTELGQDKSRDIVTDMEVGRLVFPSIRSTVENYIKKYD